MAQSFTHIPHAAPPNFQLGTFRRGFSEIVYSIDVLRTRYAFHLSLVLGLVALFILLKAIPTTVQVLGWISGLAIALAVLVRLLLAFFHKEGNAAGPLPRLWEASFRFPVPRKLRTAIVRQLSPTHVVGAVAIIRSRDGRGYLLARHKYPLGDPGAFWGLPGGAKEFDESVEDTIRRELRQELRVEVEIETLRLIDSAEAPYLDFVFECRMLQAPVLPSSEVIDVRYCTLEDLPAGVSSRHRSILQRIESNRQHATKLFRHRKPEGLRKEFGSSNRWRGAGHNATSSVGATNVSYLRRIGRRTGTRRRTRTQRGIEREEEEGPMHDATVPSEGNEVDERTQSTAITVHSINRPYLPSIESLSFKPSLISVSIGGA